MDHTRIVHLELHTGDLPAARALYAAACGWDPGPAEGPYLPLDLGGPGGAGLTGGIVAARAGHSLWLPYVRVASVHEATARAEALGAEVLAGPQEGPTGCRSIVSTQPGAQIAFWHPAPGARSPRVRPR
jgi:predicted enzyme related to lactoylglutathione lyase